MLGDNIKKLMKGKKITSKELASLTDVSPTHISYVINNRRQPSLDLLEKIADILEVTVDDFFKEGDTSKELIQAKNKTVDKTLPIIPEEFTDPSEARTYVDKHEIFGSEGFDPDKLDDDEILEFANALLEQMRMVSYKYKK